MFLKRTLLRLYLKLNLKLSFKVRSMKAVFFPLMLEDFKDEIEIGRKSFF